MQQLRVVTWNAEGMFVEASKTRRASPHDALATVRSLDANIIFVPEFGDTSRVQEATINALHALGYQTVIYSYGQAIHGAYGAAFLTRLPLKSHVLHTYANTGRKFVEAIVELPGQTHHLRVIGVHLDDRSEQLRLEQIEQVIQITDRAHIGETIVLGDFNAMHQRSRFAKLARGKVTKSIARRLPHPLLKSMSGRVSEMATGTTIERLLSATDLHDLDGKLRRTISAKQAGLEWAPKLRLAKIDWIFGSKGIATVSYKVLSDVGSDHRPVQATIVIT